MWWRRWRGTPWLMTWKAPHSRHDLAMEWMMWLWLEERSMRGMVLAVVVVLAVFGRWSGGCMYWDGTCPASFSDSFWTLVMASISSAVLSGLLQSKF